MLLGLQQNIKRIVCVHLVINCVSFSQVWTCEFCGHDNKLDLMPEEVPKEQDITYMLEPAPVTASAATPGVDDSLVIFCIDISGSMCVTTPVSKDISFSKIYE